MKVRATQDGHYGGFYRVAGEVFDISDEKFQVKDGEGKPIPITDPKTGKPVPGKFVMGTWFTPEWMQKMPDNARIERPELASKILVRNGEVISGGVNTPPPETFSELTGRSVL